MTADRSTFGASPIMRARPGNLGFQPLDLAGFADGARQQFHHMGQLLDLARDLANAAIAGALRFEFALELPQPARKPAHQRIEFAEFRRVGDPAAQSRGRRRKLAAADFGNGRLQRIGLAGRDQLVAFAEPVDGALDGAQRFAVAHCRLGTDHLVAQIAHPLGKPVIGGIALVGAGITPFDLIEQSHQFTAQRLPFARLRV